MVGPVAISVALGESDLVAMVASYQVVCPSFAGQASSSAVQELVPEAAFASGRQVVSVDQPSDRLASSQAEQLVAVASPVAAVVHQRAHIREAEAC
jgi:hypothetical protein